MRGTRFAKVVDQVNNDTARPAGFHLDLWRWETDSRPGFHPKGPQGLIDKVLQIDQCDLFVGIFWNRIGSPTKFGTTGTEHEFETAYESWKRKQAPEIMFYFNEKPSNLSSDAELTQRGKVLGFRRSFPEEGLYWPYRGEAEFVKYANEHLRKFVHQHAARQGAPPAEEKPGAPERMFKLKVGRKGTVTLPAGLRSLLGLTEGDYLELRVINGKLVFGVGLRDQRFDPNTVTGFTKRLSSPAANVTPSELPKTSGKRKTQ